MKDIVTANAGEDVFKEMGEYIVTEHNAELIKMDQPSREDIVQEEDMTNPTVETISINTTARWNVTTPTRRARSTS